MAKFQNYFNDGHYFFPKLFIGVHYLEKKHFHVGSFPFGVAFLFLTFKIFKGVLGVFFTLPHPFSINLKRILVHFTPIFYLALPAKVYSKVARLSVCFGHSSTDFYTRYRIQNHRLLQLC